MGDGTASFMGAWCCCCTTSGVPNPTRGDVALGNLAISGVIFSSNLLCELLLASSVYRPRMLLLRILQCETGPSFNSAEVVKLY